MDADSPLTSPLLDDPSRALAAAPEPPVSTEPIVATSALKAPSERPAWTDSAMKFGLALSALVVPVWTALLTLIPKTIRSVDDFYTVQSSVVITCFWVVILAMSGITMWFLSQLGHVWVLKYLAEVLGDAGMVVRFDRQGQSYWKGSTADWVMMTVTAVVVVALLLDEQTNPAIAVALQLGVTLRGGYEAMLARPPVALPSGWASVAVVSERALQEAVAEFTGGGVAPEDFTRAKFVESVRRRSSELAGLPLAGDGDGPRRERRGSGGGGAGSVGSEDKEESSIFWTKDLLLALSKVQRSQQNAALCGEKACGSPLPCGELHQLIIDEVMAPLVGFYTTVMYLQNGQLIILAGCALAWATQRGLQAGVD